MTEEITIEATGGGSQPPAEIQEKAKLGKEQITARMLEMNLMQANLRKRGWRVNFEF